MAKKLITRPSTWPAAFFTALLVYGALTSLIGKYTNMDIKSQEIQTAAIIKCHEIQAATIIKYQEIQAATIITSQEIQATKINTSQEIQAAARIAEIQASVRIAEIQSKASVEVSEIQSKASVRVAEIQLGASLRNMKTEADSRTSISKMLAESNRSNMPHGMFSNTNNKKPKALEESLERSSADPLSSMGEHRELVENASKVDSNCQVNIEDA